MSPAADNPLIAAAEDPSTQCREEGFVARNTHDKTSRVPEQSFQNVILEGNCGFRLIWVGVLAPWTLYRHRHQVFLVVWSHSTKTRKQWNHKLRATARLYIRSRQCILLVVATATTVELTNLHRRQGKTKYNISSHNRKIYTNQKDKHMLLYRREADTHPDT